MVLKYATLVCLIVLSQCIFANQPNDSQDQSSIENIQDTSFTLKEVYTLALKNNPAVDAFEAKLAFAQAELLQARAWRNPEFESKLNFNSEADDLDYEIELTQPIQLPKKRKLHRRSVAINQALVAHEKSLFQIKLWSEISQAYRNVTFRDALVFLANENLELTDRIATIVKKQVNAGGARPVDQTKAGMEILKAKKKIQSEKRRLATAKKMLIGLSGGTLPESFTLVETLSSESFMNHAINEDQIDVSMHPTIQRLIDLKKQKEIILEKEKLSRFPKIRPVIGYEREGDDDLYIAGIGFELPIWNQNKGEIAKSKAEIRHISAEIEIETLAKVQDIKLALEAYAGTREQILTFRDLRSAADEIFKLETTLNEQGKVDLIALLDAKRSLLETESEYLAAIYDAYTAKAGLDQALGIKGDQ